MAVNSELAISIALLLFYYFTPNTPVAAAQDTRWASQSSYKG